MCNYVYVYMYVMHKHTGIMHVTLARVLAAKIFQFSPIDLAANHALCRTKEHYIK